MPRKHGTLGRFDALLDARDARQSLLWEGRGHNLACRVMYNAS
jgi:hypothetical protein